MQLKRYKALALSGLVIAATALTSASALAADVAPRQVDISVNHPVATDGLQQKVVLDKTEAAVPSYTVSIPGQVNLAYEAQNLQYTLTLENDTAFIPSGKKVSVTIKSAGYSGNWKEFAVWNSRKLKQANYEIYYSDSEEGHRYSIGDEIVSWDGSNHGSQNRRIKVLKYDSLEPGTYTGVINYGIALTDK